MRAFVNLKSGKTIELNINEDKIDKSSEEMIDDLYQAYDGMTRLKGVDIDGTHFVTSMDNVDYIAMTDD